MITQLTIALIEANYPIIGLSQPRELHPSSLSTFYPKMDGGFWRVDWKDAEPEQEIKDAVEVFINNFVPIKTAEEQLEELRVIRKAGLQLTLKQQERLFDLLLGVIK